MPANRNRRHILVDNLPLEEGYRPHPRRIETPPFERPQDRVAHARNLQQALERAAAEAEERRATSEITVHGAAPGLYVEFASPPGVDLKLESLEHRGKGIELLAVRRSVREQDKTVQMATVFVPYGQVGHFLGRFEQYASEQTRKGEPRHKELVDRIAALRRATLRALWTDDPAAYPSGDDAIWWEVWLRRHDGRELERFYEFASAIDVVVGERRLAFDDRIVVLVRATEADLSQSLDVLNDIAELRRAKESAAFFVEAPVSEQAEWVQDLMSRTTPPPEDAPSVCVLDTGVTRAHPLLDSVIAPIDATSVDPSWGPHDDGGRPEDRGHGTEMAGIAAYGDLVGPLTSAGPVRLRHRLETVKILPPTGANEPDLYGAITAQAVARPEVTAPYRRRVFSLAVTALDERDKGQPTSWSAALDALAAGRIFDPAGQALVYLDNDIEPSRRLFVVSAGNVLPEQLHVNHLDISDLEAVHDPGQAWNAITVGAYTDKAIITHEDWEGWLPLAEPGELSPWSTTSLVFKEAWPVKPDLVMEGGNVAHNGSDFDSGVPDLCLLSTYYSPSERLLVLSNATSAATAQVARMGAIIRAEYSTLWPETVRALIVHSARWTRAMERRLRELPGKRARARLLRRYGFGVPSLERG